MIDSKREKSQLLGQLERLETALDTPPVPGELKNWASTVHKTFDEAARIIVQQIDSVHPVELEEIGTQDPGLFARVTALQQEDQRNRDACRALGDAVAEFDTKAARAGADEKQAIEAYQKLLQEGLQFVVSVRRQETALRTWLQEAFDRDSGVMD